MCSSRSPVTSDGRASSWLSGVGLIFLATAVMLVGAFFDYRGDGGDPRPPDAPGGF